jgi:hypothetical protein
VIEFLSNTGEVTNSIPTQQQLEAYRMRAEGSSKKGQAVDSAAASAAASEPAAPKKATPSIVA